MLELSGVKNSVVLQAMHAAISEIQRARQDHENWLKIIEEIFGSQANRRKSYEQIEQLICGEQIVRVELVSNSLLLGARGAYLSQGPNQAEIIYLNAEWVEDATRKEIKDVLLEEIGHAFDTRINGKQDTLGDEGRRFSNRVRGVEKRIKESLDHGNIVIDGHKYKAEFSSSNVTLVGPKVTLSAGVENNLYKITKADLAQGYESRWYGPARWGTIADLQASNATVADQGQYYLITPDDDFTGNINLTYKVENSAIGNNSFTVVADNAAPQISSTQFSYYPTPITINTKRWLRLNFNENVDQGTGNITFISGDHEIVMDADDFHWRDAHSSGDGASGTTYSYAETKIALNDPSKNTTLKQGSTYHVKIDSGFVVDHSVNDFAGVNDNTTITFETVGDGTPPNINPRYPRRHQTSVQVIDNWGFKSFRFDIGFDEEVKANQDSQNKKYITITNGSDDTRRYWVGNRTEDAWDSFSNFVRLEDKTGDLLKYGENYSVLIDEGAFVDEAGNEFAGLDANEWKFRTEFEDYPANKSTPAVINYIHQEDHENNNIVQTIRGTDEDWIKLILDKTLTYKITLATEYPLNINSYWHTLKLLDQDENIIAEHGGDRYVKPEINKRINAGTYYLSVASKKAGDYTLSVKGDYIAPKLVSKVPAYNTNNVDPRSDIVITYDELVQAGSGEILISDENGDTRRIDINDGSQITINGSSININPTDPFNSNTAYNVQFTSGTITDQDGNTAEAISNTKQFSFHTGVNATTELTNIIKIPSHAHNYKYEEIAVHFNQPLKDVAAETTDFNISLDGVNQDIASLRIVNNVVHLKPTQVIPISSDIKVSYKPNSDNDKKIKSLAGIDANEFSSMPAKTEIEVAIAENRILKYDKIAGMSLGVNESHVYSLAYKANDYRYDRLKPSSLINGTVSYELINGTLTRVDTPILAYSYYNKNGELIQRDNSSSLPGIVEGEQIYLVVRDMSNKNDTAMLNRNSLRNTGRVGQGSGIPYRVWSDTRSPATLRGSINSGPVLHLGDIAGTVNIGGSKDTQRLMMPELFDGGLYITFYLMGDGESGDYIQAFTRNAWNDLDIDELKLYDSKSQVIKTFTGNAGQGAQKIDLNGIKSGEYILKVSNSTTWNPYSLEFKAPASHLEGSTDEAALVDLGVINKDTKRSGLALNKGSDTDRYKFKLTEDSNVGEIFIDYAKGRSDFYIELYKSNQDHLIYKADSGLTYESIKLHDLPEGEYDLKVGSNNNKDGEYSIGFAARATQVDPERYESIKHLVAGDSNSGGKSEQEVVGNETYKHAFFLGNVAPGITNFSNLSINSETDVDYYRIANNLNKSISEITLEFAHGRGDLKLEVLAYRDEITGFDDPKAVVKSSDSKSDDEIVKPYLFGDLIVKVSGVNGATNEYSIKTTVDQPAYKDNVRDADDKDGKEEINPLYLSNGYRLMEKLTIHNPTDVDTYSFTLTEDGTKEDHIIIKHPERHASASGNTKYIHYGSRGAVDFNIEAAKVELYDKAGTTLIRSPYGLSSAVEDIYKNTPSYIPGITINNQAYSNKLELDGIPAGDYTIKVSSTKNTAYSIDANAKIKPTITPDRYEANTGNDSLNTAIDLGVLSQATPINNLTITAATNYYKHPKIIAADHDYFKFQVAKKTRDIGTFDLVTTSQRKDYGSKILYQILDANGKVVHGNSNTRQELTGFLLPNIDYYLKFEGQDICTHVSGEEIITPIEYDFTINPIATTLQESYYPVSDRFEGKDRNDTRETATSLGLIQGQKTISGLTLDNDNGASEWQGTTPWLRASEWYFLDKQRYEDLADIDIYSFSLDDIYYGFNDNIQLVGNIGYMSWGDGEQLGEIQKGHYWIDNLAVTKNNVRHGEIWSDDFKTYYGESHNLSHLGGGDYHLVVRRTSHESNILSETRNQYDIKFNLSEKDSQTGRRKGDQYEGSDGNNTRESAVWVNELDNWQGDILLKGSIHTRFDDDWFKFKVPEKIRPNQFLGTMVSYKEDIDAYIYNEAGDIVDSFTDTKPGHMLRTWSGFDAGTYYLKVQAKEIKRNYDETVDDYGDYKIELFHTGGHLYDYLPNENSTHIPRYNTSYVGEENRRNYYENATKIDNVYESLDGSVVELKDLALVPSLSDHSIYGITTAHEYVFELENRPDSGDYIEIRSHQNIAPVFQINPLPESAGGARLSVSDKMRNSREAKYNRNSKANRVYLAGMDAGKYSLGVSSIRPHRAIGFNIRSDYDIIINGPPNPEKGDRYEKTSGNQKKNAISIDQSRENVEIKDLTIHYAADRDIFKFVLPRYGTESDFISVEKNISSLESDLLVSLYRENNLPSLQGFKPIEHFLTLIKGRSSEWKRPISKVDRTTTIDLDGLDPATYYVIVESKTPVNGSGVPERTGEPFLPQNYTLNANIPLVNNNEEDIYEALETNESFDLGSITERFKLKGLTITPDDLDKRQFSLSKEGTSEQGIGIEFDHLISNMKLEIVNKDDNSIAITSDYSTADRNYEWVSFENLKAGNYEAIVSGYGGDYNFEFVGGNSSESDYNVKDNTINEAITITEGKTSGYSIGGQDQVDYYKFSTNYKSSQRWEGEKDNIQIDFWHQLGNIDLELLSEDGSELLAYSYGFENNERIDLVELPADDYILKVIGRGAINNYSLDLNLPTAPPSAEDSLDNHIKENAYRPIGTASTKSWERWGGWEPINATLSPSNTEDWYTATFDSPQPGPSFHTYMNRIGREGKYNEVYVDVYQKIPGEAELQPYHQYNQRSPGAMHQSTDSGFYGAGEYYWKVTGLEMTGVTSYAIRYEEDRLAPQKEQPIPEPLGDVYNDLHTNNWFFERSYDLEKLSPRQFVGNQWLNNLGSLERDLDVYTFQLRKKGDQNSYIKAYFEQWWKDLDLWLFDNKTLDRIGVKDGSFKGSLFSNSRYAARVAWTSSDNESISLDGLEMGEYSLVVVPYQEFVSEASYQLEFNLPEQTTIADPYEPNEEFNKAYEIGAFTGRRLQKDLSIHDKNDIDIMSIETKFKGESNDHITLEYYKPDGLLNLTLLDSAEKVVAIGESTELGTTISLDAIPKGNYYLKVAGQDNDTNNYSINYELPTDPNRKSAWTIMYYFPAYTDINIKYTIELLEAQLNSLSSDVNLAVMWDQPNWVELNENNVTGAGAQAKWNTVGRSILKANSSSKGAGLNNRTWIGSDFEVLSEKNMGDANNLVDFIKWANTEAPAENQALFIHGHSSGLDSIITDIETGGDGLKVEEVALALEDLKTQKLDLEILRLDGCLTGTLEFAYELRNSASYTMGSEAVSGAGSGTYLTHAQALRSYPHEQTPELLAINMVLDYDVNHGQYDGHYKDTLSAIKTDKLADLASAISNFVDQAATVSQEDRIRFDVAREFAPLYGGVSYTIDLGSFMLGVSRATALSQDVRNAALNVVNKLKHAVVAKSNSELPAGGLSIYYPRGGGSSTAYEAAHSQFIKDTKWDQFLSRQVNAGKKLEETQSNQGLQALKKPGHISEAKLDQEDPNDKLIAVFDWSTTSHSKVNAFDLGRLSGSNIVIPNFAINEGMTKYFKIFMPYKEDNSSQSIRFTSSQEQLDKLKIKLIDKDGEVAAEANDMQTIENDDLSSGHFYLEVKNTGAPIHDANIVINSPNDSSPKTIYNNLEYKASNLDLISGPRLHLGTTSPPSGPANGKWLYHKMTTALAGTKQRINVHIGMANNSEYDAQIIDNKQNIVDSVSTSGQSNISYQTTGSGEEYTLKIRQRQSSNQASDSLTAYNKSATYSLLFTPGDSPALRLDNSTPGDNSQNFNINSNIKLEFNAAIFRKEGFVHISDGRADIRTINISDNSQVNINGSTLTINPTNNLNPGTSYHILIDKGAIVDSNGNSFSGITNTTTLNFATRDNTPPAIINTVPLDNAKNINNDTNIEIEFSKTITRGTGSISINDGASETKVEITDSSQISIRDGNTLVFNPSENLKSNRNYHIKLDNTAIKDFAGNPFAGINSASAFNFHIADTDKPLLTQSSPTDDSSNHSINDNLVLTFSEDIQLSGNGSIQLHTGNNNKIVPISLTTDGERLIINPNSTLNKDSSYYVIISNDAITDAASTPNRFDGINSKTDLNFTTEVNNKPVLNGEKAKLAAGKEDLSYTIKAVDLLLGYADSDGDTLAISGLKATNGALKQLENGNWQFNPAANFHGTVELSYNIKDGYGGSVAASNSFTLAAVNDPPLLSGKKAKLADGSEDRTYKIKAADLLAGYTDLDGDNLSITGLKATNGSLQKLDVLIEGSPFEGQEYSASNKLEDADGLGQSAAAASSPPDYSPDYKTINGRTFGYYVPDSYDPSTPTPLLFMFHGMGGNSSEKSGGSAENGYYGWQTTADENGFIVLFPESLGLFKTWDLSAGGTSSDLSFVDDLIDWADTNYNISRSQVFTTGHSWGAYFSYYVARYRSEDIAAFAAHSGGLGGAFFLGRTPKVPSGPSPTPTLNGIVLHAADDRIVPYSNSQKLYDDLLANGHNLYNDGIGEDGIIEVDGWGPDNHRYRQQHNQTQWDFFLDVSDDDVPLVLNGSDASIAEGVRLAEASATITRSDAQGNQTGTLTIDATKDGHWQFNPDANFHGTVELTYNIKDGNGGRIAANNSFTLAAVNDPPLLSGKKAKLEDGSEDRPYKIKSSALLEGYTDIDGEPLSIGGLKATNGSLQQLENGNWQFNPAANFHGTVQLSYKIKDGNGGSIAAGNKFALKPVNDHPLLSGKKAKLEDGSEDRAYKIKSSSLLEGYTDVDGDKLSIGGLKATNGSLQQLENGNWNFTPDSNFHGTVELTYNIKDSNGGSITAGNRFALMPVNDQPLLSGRKAKLPAGTEDSAFKLKSADLLEGYSDIDGDKLLISDLKINNGSLQQLENGNWHFTPAANFHGTIELTYNIKDSYGGSVKARNSFALKEVNDSPLLSGRKAKLPLGTEDSPYKIKAADLLEGYTDVDGDALLISDLKATNGSLQKLDNGSWRFTPKANFNGTVELTYTIIDGNGGGIAAVNNFALKPVIDQPLLSDKEAELDDGSEDRPYKIKSSSLLEGYTDVDGDKLSIGGLKATNGSLQQLENGNWQFTPDANFHGTVELSYNIKTGKSGSIEAGKIFTLEPVNDQPLLSGKIEKLDDGSEDRPYKIKSSALIEGYTDVDEDALLISELKATNGTLQKLENSNWQFNPDANFHGTVDLTYTIIDGNGGSVKASNSFSLAAVNDPPLLIGKKAELDDGSEGLDYRIKSSDLIEGYTDVDGDSLLISDLKATNGSLQKLNNGSWRFTPEANFNQTVELTYNIKDGNGGSTKASNSFSLAAVNDPPLLSGKIKKLDNGSEDRPYQITSTDLLAGYTDSDGDKLSISDLKATNGSIHQLINGSWKFTPDANFHGTVQLTYTIKDGNGGSSSAENYFELKSVNDQPLLSREQAELKDGVEDRSYKIRSADLLEGFTDIDGDLLSIRSLKATNGSLQQLVNGNWKFTPDANFHGTVELSYQIKDTNSDGISAENYLELKSVNDKPLLTGKQAELKAGLEDRVYKIKSADLLEGFTDIDGDLLSIHSLKATNGALRKLTNSVWRLTPDSNFHGTVELTYNIKDGEGGSIPAINYFELSSVNDSPIGIQLSALNFDEKIASGSVVAAIKTIDEDSDTHTYSLVKGGGDSDNSDFMIDGNQLRINQSPDHETKSSYRILMQTMDSDGLSLTKAITLTVNDITEQVPLSKPITKPSFASIENKIIAIEFPAQLNKTFVSKRRFRVTIDGLKTNILQTNIEASSGIVLLTLNKKPAAGAKIILSYTDLREDQSNDIIEQIDGTDIPSFSNFEVQNDVINSLPLELISAEVIKDTLTLDFNGAINQRPAMLPTPASFKVKVNGRKAKITAISGGSFAGTLNLTLKDAVEFNDKVTLDYRDLANDQATGVIENLDGDDLATFSNIDVTNNNLITSRLAVESAYVDGSSLEINFDREIAATKPSHRVFQVEVDGKKTKVKSVDLAPEIRQIILELEKPVTYKQIVTISYKDSKGQQNNNFVGDIYGNELLSLKQAPVENETQDLIPPRLDQGEVIDIDQIRLNFSEELKDSKPETSQFKIKVNKKPNEVASIEMRANQGQAILKLKGTIADGDTVAFSYKDLPSDQKSNVIEDISGNDLPTIRNFAIENLLVDTDPPTIYDAVFNNDQITLVFNEWLAPANIKKSRFKVKVDKKRTKISSIEVPEDDTIVQVNLSKKVDADSDVLISYKDPRKDQEKGVLEDREGNDVETFFDFPAEHIEGDNGPSQRTSTPDQSFSTDPSQGLATLNPLLNSAEKPPFV